MLEICVGLLLMAGLAVYGCGDAPREGHMPGEQSLGGQSPGEQSPRVDTPGRADSTTTDYGPPPLPVHMPAEFERQAGLLVGCSEMIASYPSVLTGIVSAVHEQARVIGLIGNSEQKLGLAQLLFDARIPEGAVGYMKFPVVSMWARDYGPFFVERADGQPVVIDAVFRERRGNTTDNGVPAYIAGLLRLPRYAVPLLLEGGDLLSNGRGLCLSSTRIIQRNQYYRQYDAQRISTLLRDYFGFREWIPLPHLEGEPTGHIDMYLTLVAPYVVVVGRLDPQVDAINAELLDGIAADLAAAQISGGPLQVERIPMPPHDDGLWRTYTNVVFVNGTLLVPVYPEFCPQLDRRAVAVYERLLPDWQIVTIDASSLIEMYGALRCVTKNIPDFEGRIELAPAE